MATFETTAIFDNIHDCQVIIQIETECTNHGSPATMPSMNYAGDPGEDKEFQIIGQNLWFGVKENGDSIPEIKLSDAQFVSLFGKTLAEDLWEQAIEFSHQAYDSADYEPDYD